MKLLSQMLDPETHARYKRISTLNMRSSIYDVTNRCNLRCKGCFFFSSGEHEVCDEEMDLDRWVQFVEAEIARGVGMAILIGGEPTLYLDRVEAFFTRMKTYAATNGLVKIPRDRFPDMMVGISLWGDDEDELRLRGRNVFKISRENYQGDPKTYYLYTITPQQVGQGKVERVVRKIRDYGLKVHMQLFSNDEQVQGYTWTDELLAGVREEMDDMLARYPDTVISSHYYHQVLTTGRLFDRKWGWEECPSVSEEMDDRNPKPRRLIGFNRWASDLRTHHRCCTSAHRDCATCKDGAATMSWIMVNKRLHMGSSRDLKNWIEIYEMFARLYDFLPFEQPVTAVEPEQARASV